MALKTSKFRKNHHFDMLFTPQTRSTIHFYRYLSMKPEIRVSFFHITKSQLRANSIFGIQQSRTTTRLQLLHTVRMHVGERRPTIINFSKSITEHSSYHMVSRKYFKTIHFKPFNFYPRLLKNTPEMEIRGNYNQGPSSIHWILWCWKMTKPDQRLHLLSW